MLSGYSQDQTADQTVDLQIMTCATRLHGSPLPSGESLREVTA